MRRYLPITTLAQVSAETWPGRIAFTWREGLRSLPADSLVVRSFPLTICSFGMISVGFDAVEAGSEPPDPDVSLPSVRDILQFEKRWEARQSEIRAGSVLGHVTKRGAVITPPRAPVVLRFLLINPQETVCFWPDFTTL